MRSLEPFLPFMKLLLSALYQLPLTHVRTYRGVRLGLFEVTLNPNTNTNPKPWLTLFLTVTLTQPSP